MKVVIVGLLSLFVISCLAKVAVASNSWRNEIVVSARRISRPLDMKMAAKAGIPHVGMIVTTNAGRSHLIHNTVEDVSKQGFRKAWIDGKPGTVVVLDWKPKFPVNWASEEITLGQERLTVQQVFNAMWGGNYKKPLTVGTYNLFRHNCFHSVKFGEKALQERCNSVTGDCNNGDIEEEEESAYLTLEEEEEKRNYVTLGEEEEEGNDWTFGEEEEAGDYLTLGDFELPF